MRNHAVLMAFLGMAAILNASALAAQPPVSVKVNPLRDAYYGDLHLHTSYSFDAYIDYGTTVDPDHAYRFAKGEEVQYLGLPVRRRQPLDFMAVTDHAESVGVFNQLQDPDSSVSRSAAGQELKSLLQVMTRPDGRSDWKMMMKAPKSMLERFWRFRQYFSGDRHSVPSEIRAESVSAWQREIDFANRNYQPGKFTTFIAYEWTSFGSERAGANLHRNVIFKGVSAPYPFTSLDSKKPEDLWAWLEGIRSQGHEALAIPHNGNSSNGLMYDWVDSDGRAIDRAYAEHRRTNEPLSEISQIKGSSEVHPLLSPNDEFANYEILDFMRGSAGKPAGSYLRDALGRGLVMQDKLGINPFKYGFVGGADLHTGLSISAQTDFPGGDDGANLGGGIPNREQAAVTLSGKNPDDPKDYSLKMTAGSLTGVWAESNTRESVYAALRRRETFATSGTELRFRLFGGWTFNEKLFKDINWVVGAYAQGVPMGADLPARPAGAGAPRFVIWAVKDPNGANLDRVQIVKVWAEKGQQQEKVFDVAWAGTRTRDPQTGRIPAIGDTVDLKTGAYANTIGATELKAVWIDPQFDPVQLSAYYLRALEIPTPRWSTLLAARHGLALPNDVPGTVQQRGWSSPIWYSRSH